MRKQENDERLIMNSERQDPQAHRKPHKKLQAQCSVHTILQYRRKYKPATRSDASVASRKQRKMVSVQNRRGLASGKKSIVVLEMQTGVDERQIVRTRLGWHGPYQRRSKGEVQ